MAVGARPDGFVLAHYHVRPSNPRTLLARNDFRAWLVPCRGRQKYFAVDGVKVAKCRRPSDDVPQTVDLSPPVHGRTDTAIQSSPYFDLA
jgi:hypothetical protein